MKSLFKKLGLLAVASMLAISAHAVNFVGTNFAGVGNQVLLSSAAKVSQLQVSAGGSAVLVEIYDTKYAATNTTNAAYSGVVRYTTNLVTTYISPVTGVTNIQTNLVQFTTTNAVAANTNVALPKQSFYIQANTVATYPLNLINAQGVMIRCSGAAGVTIGYR